MKRWSIAHTMPWRSWEGGTGQDRTGLGAAPNPYEDSLCQETHHPLECQGNIVDIGGVPSTMWLQHAWLATARTSSLSESEEEFHADSTGRYREPLQGIQYAQL
jgi:hypothetical protein